MAKLYFDMEIRIRKRSLLCNLFLLFETAFEMTWIFGTASSRYSLFEKYSLDKMEIKNDILSAFLLEIVYL